jgi:RimJ/RimL family protein N-acetyltransferase
MNSSVRLRPWTDSDLALLRLINTSEMRRHVGGAETEEQLLTRHRRYLELPETGRGVMFAVLLDDEPAGSIAYHARTWQGTTVYETGWNVLPPFQGRGVAVAAGAALVELLRAAPAHRHLHAFPSVGNAPSNALCRRLGFSLLGPCDFEYPAGSGHFLRSNDWRLDLTAP